MFYDLWNVLARIYARTFLIAGNVVHSTTAPSPPCGATNPGPLVDKEKRRDQKRRVVTLAEYLRTDIRHFVPSYPSYRAIFGSYLIQRLLAAFGSTLASGRTCARRSKFVDNARSRAHLRESSVIINGGSRRVSIGRRKTDTKAVPKHVQLHDAPLIMQHRWTGHERASLVGGSRQLGLNLGLSKFWRNPAARGAVRGNAARIAGFGSVWVAVYATFRRVLGPRTEAAARVRSCLLLRSTREAPAKLFFSRVGTGDSPAELRNWPPPRCRFLINNFLPLSEFYPRIGSLRCSSPSFFFFFL